MKFKCKCGETHEFTKFETFPTTWGGRTSLFETTCLKLDKHMVLVTNTFPPSVYLQLCPDARTRKYIQLRSLMDWDQFMKCDWVHGGEIRSVS